MPAPLSVQEQLSQQQQQDQAQRQRRGYVRLGGRDTDQYHPLQFLRPPSTIPWKPILFAIFLCVLGIGFITLGIMVLLGYITREDWVQKAIPLLVVGTIMFIPGFYHVRLAFYAWRGYEGFAFDRIPSMEN